MMQTTVFEQVRETLYHEKLPNGLSVFLLPKQGFSKTYAVCTARFGSIHNHFRAGGREVKVPDGVAHFLEHKMFEKKNRDVFQEFSKNGASYNAFTSFSRTAYLFSSTERVEENLNLLLDLVQEPYFTDQNVEKEKGIIGQEIRMYDDNPDWKAYMNLLKAMYQQHPVRIEIAGSVESIAQISKETLYQCYEAYYHPANMLLFVVGAVDPEQIMDRIRHNQMSKHFPPAPAIENLFPTEPAEPGEKRIEHHLAVGLPKCMIGFKDASAGLSGKDLLKRELTTKLILEIFLGTGSPLYQQMYDDGLITPSFEFDYICDSDYGYSVMGGDTPNPDLLAETIQQGLENLVKEGIQEGDFERSKRMKIGQFLRSLNSVEFIANQFTAYKFNGTDLFEVLPVLESVTLNEVNDRLREHFRQEQMAVSIIWSASKKE